MPDDARRAELLDTLERKLRAWMANPSWCSFQPVSKILKQLEETPQQD